MGDKDKDRIRQTGPHTGETPLDQPDQTQTWDQDRPRDWEKDTTDYEQGDMTRPAQPDGTTPLERDMWPKNQKR
jgi:hypothetical protein